MSIYHYALAPEGYLLLGTSEAIGAHTDSFVTVDRKAEDLRQAPGRAEVAGRDDRVAVAA